MTGPWSMLLVVSPFLIYSPVAAVPEYREECGVFQNITQLLMRQQSVHMNCQKNVQCTGFHCSGVYNYDNFYTRFRRITLQMCFGMVLHPCSNPLNMQIYVESPQINHGQRIQRTFTRGDEFALPGASFPLLASSKADVFIHLDMKEERKNSKRYLTIGLKLKVRLTLRSIEIWPPDLAKTIMPDTSIPIPECERDVVTPSTFPPCHFTTPKPGSGSTQSTKSAPVFPRTTWPSHTGQTAGSTQSTKSTPVFPRTTWPSHTGQTAGTTPKWPLFPMIPTLSPIGARCDTSDISSCGPNMVCRHTFGTPVCQCIQGYQYMEKSQSCVGKRQKPHIFPNPTPGGLKPSPTGASNTGISPTVRNQIIIGVFSVFGAGVLSALLVFVIVRRLKNRARYAQHELLLSNEDDQDFDTNPVA